MFKQLIFILLFSLVNCEELTSGQIAGIIIASLFCLITWPFWLGSIIALFILLPWIIGFIVLLIICFPVLVICAPCIAFIAILLFCCVSILGSDDIKK